MVQLLEVANHKNKQYDYFQHHFPELKETISRFEDYIYRVLHNQEIVETRFLLKLEQRILSAMISSDIIVCFDGGMDNATYQKAILIPKLFQYETLPEIMILKASFNPKFYPIEYKDVLGAVLNLGIKRNRIGDIFIDESRIFIACDKDVVELVKSLSKIKRQTIHFEKYDNRITIQRQFEVLEKVVSSLRLDTIVAALTKQSRLDALHLINAGVVKVNEQVQVNKSYLCNIDDELVIRKYGKYRISKIKHKTKKDNLILQFEKFK